MDQAISLAALIARRNAARRDLMNTYRGPVLTIACPSSSDRP